MRRGPQQTAWAAFGEIKCLTFYSVIKGVPGQPPQLLHICCELISSRKATWREGGNLGLCQKLMAFHLFWKGGARLCTPGLNLKRCFPCCFFCPPWGGGQSCPPALGSNVIFQRCGCFAPWGLEFWVERGGLLRPEPSGLRLEALNPKP